MREVTLTRHRAFWSGIGSPDLNGICSLRYETLSLVWRRNSFHDFIICSLVKNLLNPPVVLWCHCWYWAVLSCAGWAAPMESILACKQKNKQNSKFPVLFGSKQTWYPCTVSLVGPLQVYFHSQARGAFHVGNSKREKLMWGLRENVYFFF